MNQGTVRATELGHSGHLLSEPASPSAVESAPGKRTCEGTSLPISNKKTKEADAADRLPTSKRGVVADLVTNMDDAGSTDGLQSNKNGIDAWPLRSAKAGMITDNDVLVDVSFAQHRGNVKFCQFLESKRALYQASKMSLKSFVIAGIVREWRLQDPPGRFLKVDARGWNDVGDEVAGKKISVTLGRVSRKQRESCESSGTVVSHSDEDQPSADETAETAVAPLHANAEAGDKKCDTSPVASNNGYEGAKPKKIEATRKASASPKENVLPHDHGSMYIDILSFFTSTPFDADSMRSLHGQKELSIAKMSPIVPTRASLPIVPQKLFMVRKASASGDAQIDAASPKSYRSIEREVSKFLLEEAEYLMNQVHRDEARPNPDSKASNTALSKSKNCGRPLLEETHSSSTGRSIRHNQLHPFVDKFGNADSRKPFGAIAPVSRPLSLPYAQHSVVHNAPLPMHPVCSVLHYSHLPAMTAYPQALNIQSVPNIAVVRMANNALSEIMQAEVATISLPHVNNTSKNSTQASTDRWMVQGTKATMSTGMSSRVSIDGKHGSSACGAPKTPKTTCATPTTPKTPRTPAILLSTEVVPSLDEGWISKTFQRSSGRTAGTKDSYFYSPHKRIKFRSMKGCKTFIDILAEPGVDGDEFNALEIYKERGHRL
mmetsp:Transcript_42544/g.90489  ORF Transcript_42544/g.90489 Transcript_42544/m.90489 type:complete len:660 (+) Transcript_42544:96-2075(+)